MSEPIPEAVPTSADPRSRRPVKRIRTGATNTASATQADEIDALMWDPTRPIALPPTSEELKAKFSPTAPPEIVANVQGSSAGAGSGEFHVYKASRRREYERLRAMDEEAKKEDEDRKWTEEEKLKREKDDEKTRKNREKRNRRKKAGKGGGEGEAANGGSIDNGNRSNGIGKDKTTDTVDVNGVQKKDAGGGKLKPALHVAKRERERSADSGNDFAVADVVKESGITIHDDD